MNLPVWAIVAFVILGLFFIHWLSGIIWLIHPYKAGTWFWHDIMHWHKPDGGVSFDGCSAHSHCKFCKKEILQDSQGNWFTF